MKLKNFNVPIKLGSFFNKIAIITVLLGTVIYINTHIINRNTLVTCATNKQKIIYLTFDDGPSNTITDQTLDILKEKGIKATFFIVGYRIQGREEVLKRMLKEGHCIGLHSYTHNCRKIYSSEKCFIDEMDKTRDTVRKITGTTSNIIRFPTGSKPHLNKSLLNKLHAKNYKIYDWNAALSDGLNCNTPPSKLFKESTKVIGENHNIILLMHCAESNKNTCKALPKIIEFYEAHGYEFKAITDTTPEFYFKFK